MTTPRFDTKIAVALRDDLATWQRLNVTAFLASAVAAARPDVVGEPYGDADGTTYLPMFAQPVMVFQAGAEVMQAVLDRAVGRALDVAVFVDGMFATGHDAANRAVVRQLPRAGLAPAGLAVFGPRNGVDKALKGAVLHP